MKNLFVLAFVCLLVDVMSVQAQRIRPIRPGPRPIPIGGGGQLPEADPNKSIAELVKELDSDDAGVRLAAVVALAERGDKATPAVAGLVKALQAKDDDLRLNAALALGKIGTPAVKPLTKQLDSEDVDTRFYTIWALGWIGPAAKETAPQIVRALGDKNESIRRKAAYALGQLNADPELAIDVLIKAFDDESVDVRHAAAEAVAKYGTKAVAGLVATMNTGKDHVRIEAANALGHIGSDAKDAVPDLRKLFLAEGKTGNANAYAETLAKIGKAAVPAFTEALKDDRAEIRQIAIQSLGKLGADGAGTLVDALGSKRVDVRRQSAQTLAPQRISDKMVVLALAYALKDDDELVRQYAMGGLQMLGISAKLAAPHVVAALADTNYNTRMQAFYLLQQMGENPRTGLLKALDSKSDKIRINTAALMVMVGFERNLALPVLSEGLKHDDLNLRMQAAYALAQTRTETDKIIPILVDGLKSKSSGVRQQALESLSNLGQIAKVAAPALVELFQDPDANLRQRAIYLTQQIRGDPEIMLPALGKLLEDSNQQVRSIALQVIGVQGRRSIPYILGAIAKEKDNNVKQQAIYSLQSVQGDVKEALPQVAPLLKSDNAGVRQGVAQLMAHMGEPAVPHLLDALKDSDVNIRLTATQSLRSINPEHLRKAIPILVELINDTKDPNARNQVIWSLANLGPEGADVLLKVYKENDDASTRQITLNALVNSQQRAKALPLVIEALKSKSDNIRLVAVQSIQNFGQQAKEAVPLLGEALRDTNPSIRFQAAYALGSMGDLAHQHLEGGLKSAKDSNLRQAILQGMSNSNYRSKTGVPSLISALKDGTPQVRWMAAHVLGRIGPDASDAIPALTELSNDTNQQVRNLAANALRQIKKQ